MRVQELGADLGIPEGALHAQLHGFQRARQQPAGVRVQHRAEIVPHTADLGHHLLIADDAAGDKVRMPADIFGQRIEREIGAVLQRLVADRAHHRVVAHQDRPAAGLFFHHVADAGARGDVDERVGGIGGRLGEDHRDRSKPFHGSAGRRQNLVLGGPGIELGRAHAPARQERPDENFGGAVERARMQHGRSRLGAGEQRGGDRRHAGGESERCFAVIIERQAVFQHFHVGVVEACVDQVRIFRIALLVAPGKAAEQGFSIAGRLEGEGGGHEDRRLDRAFRHEGVVAEPHHQGFRAQRVTADFALAIGFLGL